MDEAAVELQLGKRQLAQSRERRKPLAEVVDRERDAVDAQLGRDLVHQRDILNHFAFGDFEDETGPLVAPWAMLADERRKLQVRERTDRCVGGDVEMRTRPIDLVPVTQRRANDMLGQSGMTWL